jgi:hypothetical protein
MDCRADIFYAATCDVYAEQVVITHGSAFKFSVPSSPPPYVFPARAVCVSRSLLVRVTHVRSVGSLTHHLDEIRDVEDQNCGIGNRIPSSLSTTLDLKEGLASSARILVPTPCSTLWYHTRHRIQKDPRCQGY